MNIIINNCKQVTRITGNLLKNGNNLSKEYATTVADYKITWIRPEKVSSLSAEKSGDLGMDINVKSSDFCNMYNESLEMKDANDIVKKMYTLEFQPRQKTNKVKREKFLELVKRHNLDNSSPEAIVAITTSDIYHLREQLEQCPKNPTARTTLSKMIDKRKKYLAKLRKWDYRRFEWLLEKMNLIYKPMPAPPLQIIRKESLRRLTEKYCDKLIQDKLNAYETELREMQKDFYVEKAKMLSFIREEELACGLQPSVSEEDIVNTKQKASKYYPLSESDN